jgi:putative aminopeptidase FrvX
MIMELCALPSPAGFEGKAFERVQALLAPYVDEIKTDAMGNLIAVRRCGKPDAKKLMLDAHMDEIGLIVTGHDEGFLRFSSIGGVDQRMLPAREVKVLTEPPIFGVIDTLPVHTLTDEEMEKSIDADKLFIDVGLTQEEAVEKVPLGTPVVYAGGVNELMENILCGKSLDDRSCVSIILKTMEELAGKDLSVDLYCLISTQEELGTRGATVGAYTVAPDYAIALDVTFAATPDTKKGETMELRKGAAIGVGPNMHRTLTQQLIDFAKAQEIPYQLEIMGGSTGTDGWPIQVSREGVATLLVSLPIRCMHTPVETMDLADAENIVKLLTGFIPTLGVDEGGKINA